LAEDAGVAPSGGGRNLACIVYTETIYNSQSFSSGTIIHTTQALHACFDGCAQAPLSRAPCSVGRHPEARAAWARADGGRRRRKGLGARWRRRLSRPPRPGLGGLVLSSRGGLDLGAWRGGCWGWGDGGWARGGWFAGAGEAKSRAATTDRATMALESVSESRLSRSGQSIV